MDPNAFWSKVVEMAVTNAVAMAALYVLFHLIVYTAPAVLKDITNTWIEAIRQQTETYTSASVNQTRLYTEHLNSQNALLQSQTRVLTEQMMQHTAAIKDLELQVSANAKLIMDMQASWRPSGGRRAEDKTG